jgi:hypothetical protein
MSTYSTPSPSAQPHDAHDASWFRCEYAIVLLFYTVRGDERRMQRAALQFAEWSHFNNAQMGLTKGAQSQFAMKVDKLGCRMQTVVMPWCCGGAGQLRAATCQHYFFSARWMVCRLEYKRWHGTCARTSNQQLHTNPRPSQPSNAQGCRLDPHLAQSTSELSMCGSAKPSLHPSSTHAPRAP